MPISIPTFHPEQAKDYVSRFEDPAVMPFVKLLYLRQIEGIKPSDSAFLNHQKTLLPKLSEALTTWLQRNIKRFYACGEVFAFFGYLGLNGTVIPQLRDAIKTVFEIFPRKDGGFMTSSGRVPKCPNTAFLRAALRLGFAEYPKIKAACFDYLSNIVGKEGDCHVRTDGNPCAYVLVRTLLWLNEFPQNWRNQQYGRVVKNIQTYLLSYDLSRADYPRRRPEPNKNWFKFGYFRSFQSSIFEATEALAVSGVKDHPELHKALDLIGSQCLNGVTWKPRYQTKGWPLTLEPKRRGKEQGSPWLTLRGLRITDALA